MKKRLLSFVVFAAVLCMMFPSYAEDSVDGGAYGDNLTWEYNTATKTLEIGGNGMADKGLQMPWSKYSSEIETAVISDGVMNIPDDIFLFHTALKNLYIGKSVKKIGDYAFCSDFNFDRYIPALENIEVDADNQFYCSEGNVLFNKDKTELVKYPGGRAETEYNLPETVRKINYKAFLASKNLQEIGLNGDISEIDGYAFKDCTSLENIILPDNLTVIGADIFSNTAYTNDKTAVYTDGVLYSGNWAVKLKTTAENINLRKGTVGLLDGCLAAYFGSASLKTLFIPETVRVVPKNTFERCRNLVSINVNENNSYYTSIDGILYNKERTELLKVPPKSPVTDLNLPDAVTAISKSALSQCESLENVTIPPSVINIEKTVFTDCTNLKKINVANENEHYVSVGGVLYDKNKTMLMAVPKKLTVAKLELPDTVITIAEKAASDCTSLAEVIFPESLRVVEGHAFDECSSLKFADFNYGLMQIGEWAFYGCKELNITEIPRTVKDIGSYAFWATLSEQTPENWQDGVYFYISNCLLHTREDSSFAPTSFELRDGTRLIAQSAFSWASDTITEVVIPETLEYINDYVFGASLPNIKTVLCYKTPDEWQNVVIGSANYNLTDAEIKYMPFTRSEISETDGGYIVKVTALNIPDGKNIIVAGYSGDTLSEAEDYKYAGKEESVFISENSDKIIVYVWDDNLTPYVLKPETRIISE